MEPVNPIKELKRRDACRAGNFYTVTGWPLIQDSDTAYPRIGPPGSAVTLVIALFVRVKP